MSKQFLSSKHPRIYFPSKNMRINRQNLGIAIGFGVHLQLMALMKRHDVNHRH